MFLIPQFLTATSTASKVSRSSSRPAHNTGQAMATQTKTQQLVCPRRRAGMGMQTASEHMLLHGTMSKPPLVRACCCTRRGTRAGAIDAPVSCAICHWLMIIAKGTSMSLNGSVEEPKSTPTTEHDVEKALRRCHCKTLVLF
jgi:hypothetical protein